jgi:Sec-independent protein secretion pathway component TatC
MSAVIAGPVPGTAATPSRDGGTGVGAVASSVLAITLLCVVAATDAFQGPVLATVLAPGPSLPAAVTRRSPSPPKNAIAGITILASVITPGDVVTVTVMMMVPLILLYELSIVLSKLVSRKRRAPAAAEVGA